MRSLAIDTATAVGSVALLERDRLVSELLERVPQRHLEWLAPAIQHVLTGAGWHPGEIEAVAVTSGPGSFTGLRIGIATATAWARARGIPLVAVSTLETVAEGVDTDAVICPLLDARRGEVAAAAFDRRNGVLHRLIDDIVGPLADMLARLPVGRPVVFAGDVVGSLASALRAHPQAILAPEAQWTPRASMAGRLAWRRLARGEHDDPYRLRPGYVRGAGITLGPWARAAEENHPAAGER